RADAGCGAACRQTEGTPVEARGARLASRDGVVRRLFAASVTVLMACAAARTGWARPPAPPRGAGATWEVVARKVHAQLRQDAILAHDAIEVEASGLLLTLSGTVDSEAERRRALQIARGGAVPHMM